MIKEAHVVQLVVQALLGLHAHPALFCDRFRRVSELVFEEELAVFLLEISLQLQDRISRVQIVLGAEGLLLRPRRRIRDHVGGLASF